DTEIGEKVRRPVLDQAGANSVFNVIAAAVLNNDRLDALQMKEPCKHQPGRACPNDSDLRAHCHVLGKETRRISACPRGGKGMKTGKLCTIAFMISAPAIPRAQHSQPSAVRPSTGARSPGSRQAAPPECPHRFPVIDREA